MVMKYYLLMGSTILVPLTTLAQTTTSSTSDATNPNMERYCDPTQNSTVLSNIQKYQTQLDGIDQKDPNQFANSLALNDKINKEAKKIKCAYRQIVRVHHPL